MKTLKFELEFFPSSVEPKYSTRIGKKQFVNLLLLDNHGIVWNGDYTDGNWYIFGIQADVKNIAGYAHYPEFDVSENIDFFVKNT